MQISWPVKISCSDPDRTAKKAQPKLALTRIEQILVPKPKDQNEQREIARIFQTIDRKISVHERKRATLQDLFQTMLHHLLTAQIRVDKLDVDTNTNEVAP